MSELAKTPLTELPITYDTLKALIETPTIPDRYRQSPTGLNDMYAATLYGRELGIGPMTAISQLFLVNGQASMMGQLMLALVWRAGHRIKINIDETSSTVHCIRKIDGEWEEVGDVTFGVEDAQRAGLMEKGTYQSYPKTMLTWRAVSMACRFYFPDVIVGVKYVPEELEVVGAPIEALPEFVEIEGDVSMESATILLENVLEAEVVD